MALGYGVSQMTDQPRRDRLDGILEQLRSFVAERDWGQFHDAKNLAMTLASEAGELLAELRWVPNAGADKFAKDAANRERIEREVADVAIALLLFSDRIGMDLISAIERKIEINSRNYPAELSYGRADRPDRGG